MNYSRKKFTLLVGALIIGQALTMQNAQAMETTNDENTQTTTDVGNTENVFSIITPSNFSHQGKKMWADWFKKAASIKHFCDNDIPILYTNFCHALFNIFSPYTGMFNTTIQTNPGLGLTLSLMPRSISMRDTINKGWNNTIHCTNNAVQCIKNIPNAIEAAIDNKIKNKAADAFNLNPNAPINADVIIDKVVKKTVFSLAMYTTAVTTALFTAYKTYIYAANKYQEYQKNAALDESIKQHLTDEKKAEIEQSMGKELSDNDIQEIINNIKTHATAAQDNHVTQAVVDLAVKEYINKQTNV